MWHIRDLAGNPVPELLKILTALTTKKLDDGNDNFQPSNLEVTSVDVNNPAHNIIPQSARAKFNIRFNTEHTGDELLAWIEGVIAQAKLGFNGTVETELTVPGSPFLTTPCEFSTHLSNAIKDVTGITPVLSTSGGTSDARFITNFAPVIEFGLIGKTIHQVNEYADVDDIENLCKIYRALFIRYFGT